MTSWFCLRTKFDENNLHLSKAHFCSFGAAHNLQLAQRRFVFPIYECILLSLERCSASRNHYERMPLQSPKSGRLYLVKFSDDPRTSSLGDFHPSAKEPRNKVTPSHPSFYFNHTSSPLWKERLRIALNHRSRSSISSSKALTKANDLSSFVLPKHAQAFGERICG
jgi:hypothetical protein